MTFSKVDFAVERSSERNADFRRALVRSATSRQIRGGPVGVGPGIEGAPTYEVAIVGTCQNAVQEVESLVQDSVPEAGERDAVVKAYLSSAKCVPG